MSLRNWLLLTVVGWLGLSLNATSHAARLHVAVESNFVTTLQQLAATFKSEFGHDMIISSGSTGQLFAQIKQGAPFDVYMAADMKRPQLLIDEGLATGLQIYARGQLVLMVNQPAGENCQAALNDHQSKPLAIANPDLAPYGLAAKQYLQNIQIWQNLSGKLVMGENVSQAMHMVVTGNAKAGLVAQSLLVNHPIDSGQCQWLVPHDAYAPIKQAMVLLNSSHNAAIYHEFIGFLHSKIAVELIQSSGYVVEINP
jgi:molybdate transport system substrate-binding protein